MKRDIGVYIEDILESISRIKEYTTALAKEQFSASAQVQDAVMRRLEIIGEAAKHVPEEVRKAYPLSLGKPSRVYAMS